MEFPEGLGRAGWRVGVKLEIKNVRLEYFPGVGRTLGDPPWLAGERNAKAVDALPWR